MTDRYLMTLWSKAVRVLKGEVCNACKSAMAQGTHHIIKRRYRVLRYDVKNGIPLCAHCHPIADRNSAWALSLIPEEDREYLEEMGMWNLQAWLVTSEQSRAEFLEQEADELKAIIAGGRE